MLSDLPDGLPLLPGVPLCEAGQRHPSWEATAPQQGACSVSREQTDLRTKSIIHSGAKNNPSNQNVQLKGSRMCHPNVCHLDIVIILN